MAEKLFGLVGALTEVYKEIDPSGEFSTRLQAYREEEAKMLQRLKEAGEITWQESHLPQEMMEKLMDKHGLTSWFANSTGENS